MKMMQQVVDDAKSLEQQTTRDEEDAQKSYEDRGLYSYKKTI